MISQLINQQIEDLLAWGFASAIAVVLWYALSSCLRFTIALQDSTGSGDSRWRHLPFVLTLAWIVAIFLVADGDHRADVVLQSDIVRFPPPAYWTGYYAAYFSNESWLDATANSFIIASAR